MNACEACGGPLGPSKHKGGSLASPRRFCSVECRVKVFHETMLRNGGYLPRERNPSPLHWNGHTRYSTPLEERRTYELKCYQCGRVWGTARLKDGTRITWRPVPCGVCGGQLYLESTEYGADRRRCPGARPAHGAWGVV